MPVFAEGTPFEGLDPGLTPLDDEESQPAAEAFAAGTDFEGLDPGFEVQQEEPEPKEEAGYLDQLRAGYFELRKSFKGSGAIDRLATARDVEQGDLALNEFGSVIPGREVEQRKKTDPGSLATAKQKDNFVADQFVGAGDELDQAAEFKRKADEIPFSEETLDFLDSKRGVPAFEAFKRAPFKIIAEIGLRSGVNSVPVIAGAIAGGAAGGLPGAMAGSGAVSARIEYVNSLIESLEKEGVDTLSVDALKAAVDDEKLMARAQKRAAKRAGPIAALDAATMGAAGVPLAPFKGAAARVAGNLAAQSGVQVGGGMAGEKLAQVATGEKDNRAVLAEGVGELVTTPVDVATATSKIVRGEDDKPITEEEGDSPLRDLERAQNAARQAVAERGGDNLEQEMAAAVVQAEATSDLAAAERTEQQKRFADYVAGRQSNIDKDFNKVKATEQLEQEVTDTLVTKPVKKAMQRGEAINQVEEEAAQQIAARQSTQQATQATQPAVQQATQQAEQQIQEELQGGQAARDAAFDKLQQPIDKSAAFDQAERQRQDDTRKADAQRELQRAEQPLTEPNTRSLNATTTLEEASPNVFRTLKERRAAIAASKSSPAEARRAPAPEQSTTPAADGKVDSGVQPAASQQPAATEAPPAAGVAPKTLAERRARGVAPVPQGATEQPASATSPPLAAPTDQTSSVGTETAPKTLLERRKRQQLPADEAGGAAPVTPKTPRKPRSPDGKGATASPAAPTAQDTAGFSREPKTLKQQRRGPAAAGEQPASVSSTVAQQSQRYTEGEREILSMARKSTKEAVNEDDVQLLSGFVPMADAIKAVRKLRESGDIASTGPFSISRALQTDMKTATRVAERMQAEENAKPAAPSDMASRTREIYREDLPSRKGLTSMPIEKTRARFNREERAAGRKPDKAAFDKFMIEESKQGRVELIPYDNYGELTAEQRENAIQDPENKNRLYYYWRPTEQSAPDGKKFLKSDASSVSDETTVEAYREVDKVLSGSSETQSVNLFDLLSVLESKLSSADPYRKLATKLKGLPLSDVQVFLDGKITAEGWYVDRRIGLNPARFNDGNARAVLHTLLHEAVHAATSGAIDNNPALYKELTALTISVRTKARLQGVSTLDQNGREHYGIREDDAAEFVAEAFTNAKFQEFLRSVKAERTETLWQQFVRFVKEALGLSESFNFLDVIMSKTDEIFTGEREIVSTDQKRSREDSDQAPSGWSMAEPGEVPAGLTVQQAERQLKEFYAEFGKDAATVVATVADLPIEIRRAVEFAGLQTSVRGVHNGATGEVYVIAANHNDRTVGVIQTATHEFIAHKGLRAFLGSKREQIFLDVFKTASNRKWILDYAKQAGWDLRNPTYQIKVADEYIAYLSENLDFDQSLLQRVYDAMRAVLRKVGLVRDYTDNDLRRLLRMSRANARQIARANKEAKPNLFGPDLDFATDFRTNPQDRAPLQPQGILSRLGSTAEDQANYNPGVIGSRIDALKDFGQDRISTLLALIPRRNLVDFISKGKMDSTRRYLSLADRLDGRRNELMAETEKLAKRWMDYTKKNRAGARILGELMHAATLATVDPLVPYVSSLANKKPGRITPAMRQLEAERRAAYTALSQYANRLDQEGKEIYAAVRDSYQTDRQRVLQGIQERINASSANGQVKKALLDSLRKQFESGKVAGPYFPLARFGKYWAVAKDASGEVVSYVRRESQSEVTAWRRQMQAAGFKTDGGTKPANQSASVLKQIDPDFVAKVTDLADQVDPDMSDQIWQMYLQSLPETSLRKQFLHRKGRLGYTADALRSFGTNKFHAAHQIAKLEYMHRMESELVNMESEARALEQNNDSEAKWAVPLSDEFKERHKWARNPTNAAWANNLTALGFAYYLGTSPAAALVNLSQTAMVAFPTLGAEFGLAKSGAALLRAAAQWAGSRGPLANKLRGDERLAFDEALRIGLFTQTRTTDLAELGEQGENMGTGRAQLMKIITWLFQKTEQANREVTFLAAFRMAKEKGLSQEAAVEMAENFTWDSHFQYQSTNRPRFMQGDGKKVLFLFRQYSMNMSYRLARDFRNSTALKAMPPGERKKATIRLGGLLSMTFLNAGLTGLPFLWIGYAVLNAMLGTDDEPYDAEGSLRAWLEEWGGDTWASAIMDGSLSTATNATLSTRVGLGHLWLQEKPMGMNATDEYGWWLSQAAGPIGGLVFKGLKASELAEQDYGDRALEQMTPKAISDVLKLVRYARDGVTNKRGDEIIGRDELSNRDLFLQAIGFTPLQITQQYDKNRTIKNEETKIVQRRANVMNRLFLAAQNDDPTGVQESIKEIAAFNKANPTYPISASSIISSARQRSRYTQETVNGIRVEKKLRYLQEKYGND